MNENENTAQQNLWGTLKTIPREKLTAQSVYLKNSGKHMHKWPNDATQESGKQNLTKPKPRNQQEIIKHQRRD